MTITVETLETLGVCVRATDPNTSVGVVPADQLREMAQTHHLLLLRGFAPIDSPETLTAFAAELGDISMWPFGAVLELVEHDKPDDHIFDNSYVPLHWDGMYREQVPEFQIFHCVSAPGVNQGGRTTFTDTAAVLRGAAPADRRLWERVTGHYRRKMEFYDSLAVSPVVVQHPQRDFDVIRYNEPVPADDLTFINHPDLEFTGVDPAELAEFHRSLQAALHHPAHYYAHPWQTGDVVITDNYTLLHGREAFTTSAPRHLRRVHALGTPPLDNPALVAQ